MGKEEVILGKQLKYVSEPMKRKKNVVIRGTGKKRMKNMEEIEKIIKNMIEIRNYYGRRDKVG